jgi:hypothetical protein
MSPPGILKQLTRLYAAMLCLEFAGCAAQPESKGIQQADAEARADGYDLRRYKAHARYNLGGDGLWTVFYDPIPNARGEVAMGDDFAVHLDRAGNATLVPGR